MFVSLVIHNFPEGMAVAVTTHEKTSTGLAVMLAIAFHNIPEGIVIAVPCLAARPESPWLGVGLATLSGLAEPLGALVSLAFLQHSSRRRFLGLLWKNCMGKTGDVTISYRGCRRFVEFLRIRAVAM